MTMYKISIDRNKIDIAALHDYLSNRSYWARGRSIDTVRQSIENSLCFGVYDNNEQMIGFARIVTDYAVFAYIMDLFILEDYRKLGLSKLLLDSIMNHSDLRGVRRIMLATSDAHGLYEKYGFKTLEKPENFMEFVRSNI